MSKNKQFKFRQNAERTNVIQPGKPLFETIKGKWRSEYFGNDNPIVLELACGRGEYTVGLARVFPDRNYIGIDIKGARIWKGSGIADSERLTNVAFLRTKVHFLEDFFETDEVDEIWIIHPDPRPRKRDIKRRLTHPRFLKIYKDLIKANGLMHLKTDNENLFEYSLETLQSRDDVHDLEYTRDLDKSEFEKDHHGIITRYEQMFRSEGMSIKYLRFRFGVPS